MANASVSVTDLDQHLERKTTTDSAGYYRLADLPAREYAIVTRAANLAEVSDRIRISVNGALRADFRLPVRGRTESVTVKSEVHAIQTESSELGQVLERSSIERLPLNRRDFLQLALLTPGVAPAVQDSELSTRGSVAMHVNGGREEFNNYLLDGVDNNDSVNNRYSLQPPVDAIQEFKIATNSYSAEYGRSGAGQVNVVTRSGTNDWHGFGYEYFRNRVLDARNYFDGSEKGKYNRNQFGGGGGGPLRKDHLFLFGNFDGLQGRQGLTRLGTVPSLAERQGDLSASGVTVRDPFTTKPFPNNQIPASRISPIARRVLDLFPLPTSTTPGVNYLGQPVLHDSLKQFNVKTDSHLTERQDLSFRYSYGSKDMLEPFAKDTAGLPGFGDYVTDRSHNAMLHHVLVFGPSSTNSFLLGLNRTTRAVLPQNYATDVNALWGVNYLPTRTVDLGYPAINVAGYGSVGDQTALPIDRALTTYQLTDEYSIVHGAHNIRIGGEIRNTRQNGILDQLVRGSLSFSGALTGSGIGDLLLGLPSFGVQAQADNPQAQRTTAYNVFVQDDWKVRRNLTLNFGGRYEFNTPPTDPNDRMSVFNLQTRSAVKVGTNGTTRSGLRADANNFAPRVGFAWSVTPKTVVRGGYGIYYDAGMLVVNMSLYYNPPYFNVRVYFPTATSLLTLNDPFPTRGGITPPPSLSSLSPDLVTAYMQNWSFNIQRELGSAVFSIAYAGSKGTHLIHSRDLNQPVPGPGALASRRLYPDLGNIFFTESAANSTYHSLQASLHRTVGRGLSVIALYTFSKSIDDASTFLGTKADKNFPQNSSNYHGERGLSSFDMPHRASAALIYSIPGRSMWLRNTELRSIATVQSGQPFTPILRFDNSNTGNTGGTFGSDRPNLLRNPELEARSPQRWFDTSAFAIPPRYTFGSAGRNILRGPAYSTVDLSLARRFALTERTFLTFEAQAFNLLNRANFDLPQAYADEPATFGKIFSAKSPRQIQLALRLQF